jgi:hypothetical protein
MRPWRLGGDAHRETEPCIAAAVGGPPQPALERPYSALGCLPRSFNCTTRAPLVTTPEVGHPTSRAETLRRASFPPAARTEQAGTVVRLGPRPSSRPGSWPLPKKETAPLYRGATHTHPARCHGTFRWPQQATAWSTRVDSLPANNNLEGSIDNLPRHVNPPLVRTLRAQRCCSDPAPDPGTAVSLAKGKDPYRWCRRHRNPQRSQRAIALRGSPSTEMADALRSIALRGAAIRPRSPSWVADKVPPLRRARLGSPEKTAGVLRSYPRALPMGTHASQQDTEHVCRHAISATHVIRPGTPVTDSLTPMNP